MKFWNKGIARAIVLAIALTLTRPLNAAAPAAGARLHALPFEVVAGQSLSLAVEWQAPADAAVPLNVELKDDRSNVVSRVVQPVIGPGAGPAVLVVPAALTSSSVQIAVWLGTDWRTPLAPIWFSPMIPVVTPAEAARRQQKRSQQQSAADRFAIKHGLTSDRAGSTAGVLDDASLSAAGHREAGTMAGVLSHAGWRVVMLDASALSNPFLITRSRFRLLALTDAGRLPVETGDAIQQFPRSGGSLFVLGAPAWSDPQVAIGPGAWIGRSAYERQTGRVPAAHILANFQAGSLAGWHRSSDRISSQARYEFVHGVLHAVVADLEGWDTFGHSAGPFPKGDTLTSFRARGDGHTPQLAIEWDEKDGSRWLATVPLTTTWQRYSLPPSAFHFWESTPGRGGNDDQFHPQNAAGFSIGLAFSHTGANPGRHEYWVADFGAASSPLGSLQEPAPPAIAPLDGLFPGYKFFLSHGVRMLEGLPVPGMDTAAAATGAGYTLPSLQPRPDGSGSGKNRPYRMIPLLVSRSAAGEWRGIPAAVVLHTNDGLRQCAVASFTVANPRFYEAPAVRQLLETTARRILQGVFFEEAGARFYTYFPGQNVTLGGRIVNYGQNPFPITETFTVRIPSGAVVFSHRWSGTMLPGEVTFGSVIWPLKRWPAPGLQVIATLEDNRGQVLDRVEHSIHLWNAPLHPHFVTAAHGQFWLNGRPWKVHGVNYMPSSGIGQDNDHLFEDWIDREAYDPAIIRRDLQHIVGMGLNEVSVFINSEAIPSQNLLDLLRQCQELGLHANVSLRPGTPMNFQWDLIRPIITDYRLSENDTVFAYDLAWEPQLGNHVARKEWDHDWEAWIVRRYGSLDSAEKTWDYAVPQEAGVVTNPSDDQLTHDGAWTRMAAAYRHFTDDLVRAHYAAARRLVRTVDPHHLVSFRMTETSDPTYNGGGSLPYDFAGVGPAVDFLAPEAYGRIGGWDQVRPGWFERVYGRWAAPDEPLLWAEMGMSVWDNSRMQDDASLLQTQAQFFDLFYTMMERSGCNGIIYWWYPGGFRVGENSDFGIINPDGSDRQATVSIRKHAHEFLTAPMPPPPDVWIDFNRDRHATGLYGVYQDCQARFWRLVATGHHPGLRSAPQFHGQTPP